MTITDFIGNPYDLSFSSFDTHGSSTRGSSTNPKIRFCRTTVRYKDCSSTQGHIQGGSDGGGRSPLGKFENKGCL